ncbi:MAG TPA: M3 family metallopeptidase [Caulobacteraceae bacterium]|jgi:peptidyl-dipeptidase Dcp
MTKMLLLGAAALLALSACATVEPAPPPAEAPPPMAEPAPPAAPAVPPLSAATQEALRTNPLLADWSGSYGGVPPWDKVKPELFPAAFQAGIEARRAEVQAIASNPEAPNFENTFAALQDIGRPLGRVSTLFSVMTNNMNSPQYQALDKEWSPKLQAAGDEITFNPELFRRVETVYNNRDSMGLTAEQKRIVERSYRAYVRNGAQLTTEQKAELGRINQQLAGLFSDFASKVVNDENTWTVVDSEAQLKGLPDSMKAAFKAAADERKLPGKWVIVNTRSSVDPFLTFGSDRALRERVWKAFKDRGDNKDAEDTNATIAQIVKLRADRAKLLGFPTHAHWRMDDTMAKDPQAAMRLMETVWPAAVARVNQEVADMSKIARRDGVRTFEPWDYLYYAEKVRKAKYDLDQNEVKQYLELNNVIAASYWMANKLYGLSFKEVTGTVPTFHPDVRVYEVHDRDGSLRGLFYRDDFARPGKRSGAWHSAYRIHESFREPRTVLNSNNNNFVKGGAGEPVLISVDDAETLFHEFGHAIHTLVSDVKYPSLSGTPRDYVEFPSQVHENWLLTPPVIQQFLKHYRTGQPMPASLVNKIEASSKFNQGYATAEYLSSALVDMALHTRPDGVIDADAFERETLQRLGMPRELAMRHRLPQFNHLFTSDAYSAGYYSYLWSDVMAADTWAAFEESGDPFNPELARKMREYILASGNVYDRLEAFRQFRGRDPRVEALLEQRGFPTGPVRAGGAN